MYRRLPYRRTKSFICAGIQRVESSCCERYCTHMASSGVVNGKRGYVTLIGLGNPTVDATVEVTKTLLAEHDLLLGQEGWRNSVEAKTRTIDFAVAQKGIEIACGGSALNTIRVAKLRKAELDVFLLGRIGADDHGNLIRETCVKEGIKVEYLQSDKETKTGICAVLIEEQSRDRSIVCLRGAAAHLSLSEALGQPGFESITTATDTLMFATSYNLSTPNRVEFVRHLFSHANGKLALSLSSSAILPKVKEHVKVLLPKCSVVFGSAGEAKTWAEMCGIPVESLHSCTECIAAQLAPGGCAVITNGSKPSVYCIKGEKSVEVPQSLVVANIQGDTNGAGDAFAGAFLAEYSTIPQSDSSDHNRIRSCVEAGYAVAAAKLGHYGVPSDITKLSITTT